MLLTSTAVHVREEMFKKSSKKKIKIHYSLHYEPINYPKNENLLNRSLSRRKHNMC